MLLMKLSVKFNQEDCPNAHSFIILLLSLSCSVLFPLVAHFQSANHILSVKTLNLFSFLLLSTVTSVIATLLGYSLRRYSILIWLELIYPFLNTG